MKRVLAHNILKLLSPVLLIVFYYVPVTVDLIALRFRKTSVKARFDGHAKVSKGRYAIFVVYDLGQIIPISIRNILTALHAEQVDILLMSNTELTEGQLDYLKGVCWKIVVRDNTGFDFGAYQDGVAILRNCDDVSQVTFLNDSVFYLNRRLVEFVKRALNSECEICAAFENWEDKYHLQSFFISMKGEVFNDPEHMAFWDRYKAVSNRRWAIIRGELALSGCLMKIATRVEVIFSTKDLAEKLLELIRSREGSAGQMLDRLYFCQADRNERHSAGFGNGEPDSLNSRMASFMDTRERASQIHMRGFESYLLQGSPMIKKDIVFRQFVKPWAFEYGLGDDLDDGEREEILATVRQRDLVRNLGLVDRLKCSVGIK